MQHEYTITFDVPEGYGWTGEFRPALKGEAYLNIGVGKVIESSCFTPTAGSYPILRRLEQQIAVSAVLPMYSGYRYTGEYRRVNPEEYYHSAGNVNNEPTLWKGWLPTSGQYFILVRED